MAMEFDIANGVGIRTTIFVTGCTHNCPGCFNKAYMNFNYLISSVILIFIESLPDILVLLVKLILPDGFLFFYSFVTYVLSPNKTPYPDQIGS